MTCKKHKDLLIAIALALVVIILTGLMLDCSHEWGDDFAAYLLEGVALSNGTYQKQISLNYALHNHLDPKLDYGETHIYVWGYPLLLSLVCNVVGYDMVTYTSIVFYKLPSLFFLGLFAFVFYLLLRKRFNIPISILMVLMFSTYTRITAYTNSTLTEIVFLSMCFISFFVSEKLLEQKNLKGRIVFGILLGISLWYTFAVRVNGIMVLVCVLLQQILYRFIFTKKQINKHDFLILLPYIVFGLLFLIFHIFVLGKATFDKSNSFNGTLSKFIDNLRIYYLAIYEWLHDMILHLNGGSRLYSRIIVTSMVWINIILLFIGIIFHGFKKQNIYLTIFFITCFIGACMLEITQWIRYIFMLLPLFMMYVVYGIQKVIELIQVLTTRKMKTGTVLTRRSGIITTILCICLSLYAVFPLTRDGVLYGANWTNHGSYAFSDDSRYVYTYIQKYVPSECVIQCNQYRALMLNTGKLTIHTTGHADVADYYMHIEDCADAPGFSPDDYSEILHTDSIQLYERIHK